MGERTENPSAQALHDRAATSAAETRQVILGLASGAFAVFFLALATEDIKPPLLAIERLILLLPLLSMAAAVFASLWSAFADAQWSYCWARVIENRPKDQPNIKAMAADRDYWHRHKRSSEKILEMALSSKLNAAATLLNYYTSKISGLRDSIIRDSGDRERAQLQSLEARQERLQDLLRAHEKIRIDLERLYDIVPTHHDIRSEKHD